MVSVVRLTYRLLKLTRRVSSLNNGYTTNSYNMGVLYGIPVGQENGVFNRIMAGVSLSSTLVTLIPQNVSNQVNSFITRNGRRYDEG